MSRQRPESHTTEGELEALKQRLAALRGIGEAYFDYRGELRHFSPATRDALLAAMECDLHDAAALSREIDSIESERWRVLLPAVVVLRPARMGVALSLPCDLLAGPLAWRVRREDGGAVEGTAHPESLAEGERREIDGRAISQRLLVLPEALPCGYHTLEVVVDAQMSASCALIVAPPRCYEPEVLRVDGRAWGLAAQLYSLRSDQNWGIGDFADLRELVAHAARCGADFVGINPMHALFTADPSHVSPYSPSTRQFLNVLYIAVPDVPEYAECDELRREVESDDARRQLAALRSTPLVDYAGVSRHQAACARAALRTFPTAPSRRRYTPRTGVPRISSRKG